MRFLLLDTEGIGALDTEAQYDASVFALALLLSSYFVYNSVGSIDEGALNSLSLIAHLTRHIRVRGGGDGGGGAGREEDGAEFARHFPAFLWLVRDFALQLVAPDGRPITPKEYLEVASRRAAPPGPSVRCSTRARARTHANARAHAHTCTRARTHVPMQMHMQMHTHAHTCKHTRTHDAHMPARTHVCTCARARTPRARTQAHTPGY